MRQIRVAAVFAALVLGTAASVVAQDLTIGRTAEQSSIDPHFNFAGNDQPTKTMTFESLLAPNAKFEMVPQLATSWENTDSITWIVHLRENVKFQNGAPFTAEDVIFSIDRSVNVPNSPSSYFRLHGDITVTAVDDLTVKIVTKDPWPTAMVNVGRIPIVNAQVAKDATTQDFNSGEAAIGTGPYKFVSWTRGDNAKFARFDNYWGNKPEWENVTMRFIPNGASRVAALLSGDVDFIDSVSPNDVARVKSSESTAIWSVPTMRVVYLQLDQRDRISPFVKDVQGNDLDTNPLRDERVRTALSKLINRDLLVDRIALGGAPAAQLVQEGICGHNSDITGSAEADVEGAKALLAEAGYADGFSITIHASNDRFERDADVALAVAQMWAQGGIKINDVASLAFSNFTANATKGEYSVMQYSYAGSFPSAEDYLKSMLGTYDAESGFGGVNRGRFSDAEFDAALQKAFPAFDPQERCDLLAKAMEIGMGKAGVVPLYFLQSSWATSSELTFEAPKNGDWDIGYIHPGS